MSIQDSAVCAEPFMNSGIYTRIKLNGDKNNVKVSLEDHYDIPVKGFWTKKQDSIIDICINHTNDPSYRDCKPDNVLQK